MIVQHSTDKMHNIPNNYFRPSCLSRISAMLKNSIARCIISSPCPPEIVYYIVMWVLGIIVYCGLKDAFYNISITYIKPNAMDFVSIEVKKEFWRLNENDIYIKIDNDFYIPIDKNNSDGNILNNFETKIQLCNKIVYSNGIDKKTINDFLNKIVTRFYKEHEKEIMSRDYYLNIAGIIMIFHKIIDNGVLIIIAFAMTNLLEIAADRI